MQRNIILCVVLCALVIAGYSYLRITLTPAKKDLPAEKKLVKGKDETDKKDAKKEEKKEEVKQVKEPVKEEKKPPVKAIVQEPAKTETIGGDGYHLTVDTTSRGAGVRRVLLNRFKAADWQGRPVNPERALELIQDDDNAPAFRMYHYEQPDDRNPVFGLGEKIWKFEGRNKIGDVQQVRYSTTVPGMDHIKIEKTYRLAPKDYHVTLLLEFHDLRDPKDKDFSKTPFRYQLVGGQGLPIEGEFYASTFRNALIGVVDARGSLFRKIEESARISPRKGGDRFPEGARGTSRMQYAGVANQYFAVMIVVDNDQPKTEGARQPEEILAWARPTLETSEKRGIVLRINEKDDTILFRDQKREEHTYRLLPRAKQHLKDLDVQENQKIALSFYELPDGERIATWMRLGDTPRPQFDDITVRVNSEPFDLQPRDKVAHQFMLYHGPVKAALLAQQSGDAEVPDELVERYTNTLHLRTLTDYASDHFFGKISSFIMLTDVIIFFTKLMHWLFYFLHNTLLLPYGLAIMVLTIIVRGCMFPISRRQALFSIKMQELAPEMKKIAEKYKDDMQAKSQATMELQRKHGVSTFSSCWPVFLQMPIFLGLYFALQESIHFRLAEFLWIKNLAAPDMLIWWTENIPWISMPDNLGGMLYLGPYFNILPMVAVALMMVQQLQTMPPPTDDQQAAQQKMMKFMTIFFGIMFYKVAAGLCIYFIASSLWGCAERMLLPKKKKAAEGTQASSEGKSTPPNPPPNAKWKPKGPKPDKNGPNGVAAKAMAWWKEVLKQAEKK